MRIARFLDQNSKPIYGIDLGNNQAEILSGCLFKGLTPTGQKAPITHRLAPLDPVNIFCIGLNYLKHAKETGAELPNYPVVFMKPVSAKNHPGHAIKIPKACTNGPEVDYEAEFCVIIGKPARDVTPETALDYVLGYTCANDVSARKWQRNAGGGQWIKGKGFDTFCPLGPVLVTADEIPDPQALRIQTRLNGQTMQDGHTSDMIFSVAKLIAYLSQDITLLPGTVILTGTPDGVGVARKPPVFLKPGDKVEVEIEKIGILENPVE
jgi:2-keto-4-pentenoate hydratase/2-oxohepta-3-ene-1,7-dioic acid hydratase in catechol pathway